MRLVSLLAVLILAVVVLTIVKSRRAPEVLTQKPASVLDISPVCPWREPQRDLLILFPPATNYVVQTRILSSMTSQIVRKLGRHMTADENPLRIYRAQHDGRLIGSVLVTRVKAEHGGIEIVTGISTNGGAVQGVLIQSQREPESIAQVITNPTFLSAFIGKTGDAPLRIGEDLPSVPAHATASAQAIAEGVRNQLTVFSFAETPLAIEAHSAH